MSAPRQHHWPLLTFATSAVDRSLFGHWLFDRELTLTVDLIHSDVWGPSPINSIGESRYFVVFVDDYSCYRWVFLMHFCDELLNIYRNFANMVKTQFSKTIKVFSFWQCTSTYPTCIWTYSIFPWNCSSILMPRHLPAKQKSRKKTSTHPWHCSCSPLVFQSSCTLLGRSCSHCYPCHQSYSKSNHF